MHYYIAFSAKEEERRRRPRCPTWPSVPTFNWPNSERDACSGARATYLHNTAKRAQIKRERERARAKVRTKGKGSKGSSLARVGLDTATKRHPRHKEGGLLSVFADPECVCACVCLRAPQMHPTSRETEMRCELWYVLIYVNTDKKYALAHKYGLSCVCMHLLGREESDEARSL